MSFVGSTHHRRWVLPSWAHGDDDDDGQNMRFSDSNKMLAALQALLQRCCGWSSADDSEPRARPIGENMPLKVPATAIVFLLRLASVGALKEIEEMGRLSSTGGRGGGDGDVEMAVATVGNLADSSAAAPGGNEAPRTQLRAWEATWAVLYLACKTDNYYLEAAVLGSRASAFVADDAECRAANLPAPAAQDMARWCIDLEMPILEALEFHLQVFHAFRPMRGIVELWRQEHPDAGDTPERVEAAAVERVRQAYRTELPLTVAPPMLGWSAMMMACEGDEGVAQVLQSLRGDNAQSTSAIDEARRRVEIRLNDSSRPFSVALADVAGSLSRS